jgi:hypothetical protein
LHIDNHDHDHDQSHDDDPGLFDDDNSASLRWRGLRLVLASGSWSMDIGEQRLPDSILLRGIGSLRIMPATRAAVSSMHIHRPYRLFYTGSADRLPARDSLHRQFDVVVAADFLDVVLRRRHLRWRILPGQRHHLP